MSPAGNCGPFFHVATGDPPYDYQRRLANGPCASRMIDIPTGLSKTAAVVLASLRNCMGHSNERHRAR